MPENEKFRGSLELYWINKDKSILYEIIKEKGIGINPKWVDRNDIRVAEPRILSLIEEYGNPISENMLIKGDNLLALRTLVELFKNRDEVDRIKCVYIDPPYNTGTAFEKYNDNLEHSQWLTMMRDRLIFLKKLLRKDGLIFVQIGDDEMTYLKVLMDEIFGRNSSIGQIAIRMSHSAGMKRRAADKRIIKNSEYILVYAMPSVSEVNPVYERCNEYPVNYYQYLEFNEDNDKTIIYQLKERPFVINLLKKHGLKETNDSIHELFEIDENFYNWVLKNRKNIARRDSNIPNLEEFDLNSLSTETAIKFQADTRSYWIGKGKKGNLFQLYTLEDKVKQITYRDEDKGIVCRKVLTNLLGDWWSDFYRDMSRVDREGGVKFKNGKKPERLIQRIFDISTEKGDFILDSFLGSGTTAAVAHKMKRRWIGIEIGDQAEKLCIPRLQHVIAGDDNTGITNAVKWTGGDGFKFYHLSDSLILSDDINWNLSFEEIARGIFLIFDYSYLEELHDNVYIGKKNDRYAISSVSQKLEIISNNEISKLIYHVKEKYSLVSELEIFTNKGIGIFKEDLPDFVKISKIPESIVNKFK